MNCLFIELLLCCSKVAKYSLHLFGVFIWICAASLGSVASTKWGTCTMVFNQQGASRGRPQWYNGCRCHHYRIWVFTCGWGPTCQPIYCGGLGGDAWTRKWFSGMPIYTSWKYNNIPACGPSLDSYVLTTPTHPIKLAISFIFR